MKSTQEFAPLQGPHRKMIIPPVMGNEVKQAFREASEKAVKLRSKIIYDSRDGEELMQDVFNEFYKSEMTIYTRENFMNCAKLTVRRAKE